MDFVSEEDLSFIKRFVLASGSLKKMAEMYGVTYPVEFIISDLRMTPADLRFGSRRVRAV